MGLACTRPDASKVLNFPQKVLLLGRQNAGKTSLLYAWKLGCDALVRPLPTEDFNVEQIRHNGKIFIVWDLSGAPNYLPRWRQFYHGTNVVVIVIDGSDHDILSNVKTNIETILQERDLNDIPCVVVFNKCETAGEKIEALQKTIPSSSNLSFISCCTKDDKSCKAVLEKICSVCQDSVL